MSGIVKSRSYIAEIFEAAHIKPFSVCLLTVIAGPGLGRHPGLKLFHSQPSSPVQQQTDLQEQCMPDKMPKLAAGGVQDQACKDAQARLQSSISSPDTLTHDLNDR